MQTLEHVPNFDDLKSSTPVLKAVFWDMDGTLCNTEEAHAMAGMEILDKLPGGSPYSLEELKEICIGLTDTMVFKKLQSSGYLQDSEIESFLADKGEKFYHVLNVIENEKIFNTQVLDLLKNLKKNKIQMALVTSSERPTTEQILEKLKLKSYFDLIITQEDTELNKPDPAPYLLAMDRLKLAKEDVIIFEDSQAGLTAAKMSGAKYFQAKWY